MAKRKRNKPLIAIHILIGLPAFGKTTFGNELSRDYPNRFIKFDDYIKDGKVPTYKEIWKMEFQNDTFYNSKTIILDGLFLTNSVRKSVLSSLIDHIEENKVFDGYDYRIVYHFWNEDRDTCAHNDKGRRSVDSSVTIKNAPYEPLDVEYIEKDLNVNIVSHQVKNHTVIRATLYNKFFQTRGTIKNPDIMKSDEWSLGETCGDCYGVPLDIFSDSALDFVEFDNLIEQVCPNISFIQYKNIYRSCVTQKTRTEYDYYGGSEERAWWECDLKRLYELLKEKHLITEE